MVNGTFYNLKVQGRGSKPTGSLWRAAWNGLIE